MTEKQAIQTILAYGEILDRINDGIVSIEKQMTAGRELYDSLVKLYVEIADKLEAAAKDLEDEKKIQMTLAIAGTIRSIGDKKS